MRTGDKEIPKWLLTFLLVYRVFFTLFFTFITSPTLFFIHAFLAKAPTTSWGECEYESSLPASVVVASLIGLSELGWAQIVMRPEVLE